MDNTLGGRPNRSFSFIAHAIYFSESPSLSQSNTGRNLIELSRSIARVVVVFSIHSIHEFVLLLMLLLIEYGYGIFSTLIL
jgi:hypothetical protein